MSEQAKKFTSEYNPKMRRNILIRKSKARPPPKQVEIKSILVKRIETEAFSTIDQTPDEKQLGARRKDTADSSQADFLSRLRPPPLIYSDSSDSEDDGFGDGYLTRAHPKWDKDKKVELAYTWLSIVSDEPGEVYKSRTEDEIQAAESLVQTIETLKF